MSTGLQRSILVGGASLALLVSPLIVATTPALATGSLPDPAPTSAAHRPQGCTGVTPKRPWRLVARRADPTAPAVDIQWTAVGCTTGYRVNISGAGVDRNVDVSGGGASSLTVPDLTPTLAYRITVTSIGATGDGGVSGVYRLHGSESSATSELTLDFPDAGPVEPVAASAGGASPWINPELSWTATAGPEPKNYRVQVTSGGTTVVDQTVSGSATRTRLGDSVSAGVSYTASVTPVLADGTEGKPSRLTFGNREATRPEQVTGNAPVVQFSPVAEVSEGRVLGYEIAFGPKQTAKRVFVSAPATTGASTPWVAVDPTFAAVDASQSAVPLGTMVAAVRTITTLGKSAWTAAQTITHSEVATIESAYFAGIGHISGSQETVPRNGFLKVHGATADVQVTDLVWSHSHRQQSVPVTIEVFGPAGSSAPAVVQDVAVTHLPDAAQDAWRASDIPLPDGWTAVVLRREGTEVARWLNNGGKPCVAAVNFADTPTDLPSMWKDSWCAA